MTLREVIRQRKAQAETNRLLTEAWYQNDWVRTFVQEQANYPRSVTIAEPRRF